MRLPAARGLLTASLTFFMTPLLPLLATFPVGSFGSPAAWRSLAAICAISSGSGPGAKTAGCAGRS